MASSVAWLLLVTGGSVAYLSAARAERRAGRRWSRSRVTAFAVGAGLLAVAALPPVVAFAHHDLRGHMVQHVLVGMLAPLGLVLGAPVTLVLRTLSVPAARRVAAALRSRPVRVLSHPATAALLNVGGMAALYATPLYAATLSSPALHHAVHTHVLAAGCLFTWAVLAGPDPAPHAPPMRTRLGVLLVSVAAHATLGKLMYGHLLPLGTPHGPDEIRAAAQLMYYGGDLAEGLLAVALFATWYRRRGPWPTLRAERPGRRLPHLV
ncbi:cytochrome c oxidase assembly protein [Rubrivirga sp.]|uniref:cytochrome c oxidase assembly protein n=1 Tax=Rubrivirga sp. TaxID=1885344 RepID=UPI003B522B2E